MAKLKYDRPICIYIRKGEILEVPKDEVWKVSSNADVAAPNKILGGVLLRRQRWARTDHRHRLQDHRRVSHSMEVVLHG